MRATLTVLLVLVLLSGLAMAGDRHILKKPVPFDESNVGQGNVIDPYGPPTITNSPGEIVGTSYYAYQTNGSNGNRIAIDSDGGIHIAWMKATTPGARPRFIYYNFKSEVDGQWLGETAMSGTNGTGFVTLDLMEGGEALGAYHFADATPSYTGIAKDLFRGFGIFEETAVPNAGRAWIWPYVARNNTDGKIHLLCNEYQTTPTNIGYTYSTDGGQAWNRYTDVGSSDWLSAIICTSPVSAKTAIVYTAVAEGSADLVDVYYFEAVDGSSWNFNDPINITQFGPGSTMSAWADVDALYDYDDNLHIAYQGQDANPPDIWIWGSIMHWSAETDHSVVGTHPNTDTCYTVNYCTCISKMNLAVDPATGYLFAMWSDLSQNDVSAGGFSNGELIAAGSMDNGATWFEQVNITNSHTPNCAPPNCDSDIWSSMAEKADGKLHIMYMDDNDAGAEWVPQGQYTLNNVLYLEVPEGELIPLSVREDADLPFEFKLSQNYPNPFNANTVINITGDFKTGTLAIYDVTGRRVKDFAISDDNRIVTWDGTDAMGKAVSSGTYFYSVNVDGYGAAAVKKMTLLK